MKIMPESWGNRVLLTVSGAVVVGAIFWLVNSVVMNNDFRKEGPRFTETKAENRIMRAEIALNEKFAESIKELSHEWGSLFEQLRRAREQVRESIVIEGKRIDLLEQKVEFLESRIDKINQ